MYVKLTSLNREIKASKSIWVKVIYINDIVNTTCAKRQKPFFTAQKYNY